LVLSALQAALWSVWRLFRLAEGSGGRHGSNAVVFALAGKGAVKARNSTLLTEKSFAPQGI